MSEVMLDIETYSTKNNAAILTLGAVKFNRNSGVIGLNEMDTFYNEKIVKTENYEVNDSLKIELYRIGNKKHVFMNFDGQLGCASYFSHNRSSAKIKLENNVIVTIYHSWNVDCGKFSLKGILTNSSISKLKESPIKSIKLQGTKGFIEIENIKYKEFFMDKLGCLD